MTKDEMKAARKRMREIEREVDKIARIAAFMTESQLAPYNKMAEEHVALKEKLAAAKNEENLS